MAYELPVDLIRQVKTVTRADAGLSDYDPTGDIPPLPSLSEAVATLDPSPSYLRCKICKGKLLRGVQSVICIYCGRPNDVLPDPISFKETLACRWLLESLHLDGSEMVGQATKKSEFNREQDTPKGQVPLSDFLNLKISWPSDEEKKEIILNKQTQERNSLNLTGADLNNFFSVTPTAVASDIPKEHSFQNKYVMETEYEVPSTHNNLSFFENMQPSFESSERKEGAVAAEAKEVESHDDPSFFQNLKPVELASHSSKDEDDDGFSGWEPSFQSANSGNQLDSSKTFDPFISSGVQRETPKSPDSSGGSKVDLSSILDSVFAPGADLKDGKTQVGTAASTSMDDWNDDLWNNLRSNSSQQTGQTDLVVGVKNVVSEDATDSDQFEGQWQSNNVIAPDNTEMIGQATKKSEFNKEQGTPKGQVPLSDSLNLEIAWSSEEEKKEIILNKQTQERNSLNLTGADLDNFFSASPILVASEIPKEHSFQDKYIEATKYKETSTHNNLSFFENVQPSNQSSERKEGAVVADAKEDESRDDPSFFQNVKPVELATCSLKDEDSDAFSGWEPSFQSADSANQLDSSQTFDPFISSGVQHETPKSSDPSGGSKVDLSSILESVFGPGTDSKDGKTQVGTAASTSMDDWNDNLWNKLNSNLSQQTGQTDLPIGVKNVVSEDAKDSDWFDVGQWQSNNINAPDNTIWRDVDDSFVDWNDFTSSTSVVNVSSENSATQSHNQPIIAAGEKSHLNLLSTDNKFKEVDVDDDSFIDWNDFTSSTSVINVSSENSATQSHNLPIVAAGEKSGLNLLSTDNKFKEVDDDDSFVDWNDFTSSTSVNVSSEISAIQSHNQPIVAAGEKSDLNLLSIGNKFKEVDVDDDSFVDWNDFTSSTSVNVSSENSATQSHNQPIVAAGEKSDLNLLSTDNKFEEVDVDDDSFVDWNDFTSSAGMNVSSEASEAQSQNQLIVAAGAKSDLKLLSTDNKFKEVEAGSFSQEVPSPSLFRKENVSATLTVSGLEVSSSERVIDSDNYTGSGGPELPASDEDVKIAGSKEVERKMSQRHDLSFMLEQNLFSFKTL